MSASPQQATQTAVVQPPYPASLVITGPTWRSSLEQDGHVLLSRPEVHIGRTTGNDIVLTDPNTSRVHATISWTPQGYVLQDVGSTNGTFVEGQQVTHPVLLVPGQNIRIGLTTLHFEALQVPQQTATPPPVPTPAADAAAQAADTITPFPVQQPKGTGLRGWLNRQKSKRWWRLLLVGLGAYILATLSLNVFPNPHLVPMVLLLGAGLVPVVFVRFCWEEGAFADMPITAVAPAFTYGAVLGLLLAGPLEEFLVWGVGIFSMLTVGIIEEFSKALAAVWSTRKMRLRSEFDGLVIGAASGMGFAALETAGYGFNSFIDAFSSGRAGFEHGVAAMTGELVVRMLLAVFGHGTWTAIVGAAIWRERGNKLVRFNKGTFLAFGIAVSLHALWDRYTIGALVWGILGLIILRFFIRESIQRAKLGPDAPPPPPLGASLLAYFQGTLRGVRGKIVAVVLFLLAFVSMLISGGPLGPLPAIGTTIGFGIAIFIAIMVARRGLPKVREAALAAQPAAALAGATPIGVSWMDDPDLAAPDTPASANMVRCSVCGAACPDSSRFCWNCGNQLTRS